MRPLPKAHAAHDAHLHAEAGADAPPRTSGQREDPDTTKTRMVSRRPRTPLRRKEGQLATRNRPPSAEGRANHCRPPPCPGHKRWTLAATGRTHDNAPPDPASANADRGCPTPGASRTLQHPAGKSTASNRPRNHSAARAGPRRRRPRTATNEKRPSSGDKLSRTRVRPSSSDGSATGTLPRTATAEKTRPRVHTQARRPSRPN